MERHHFHFSCFRRMASKSGVSVVFLLMILLARGYARPEDMESEEDVESAGEMSPPVDESLRYNVEPYVNFYLYTRKYPNHAEVLRSGDRNSIERSHFDPSCETRIIIHGWKSNATTARVSTIVKDAYLSVQKYNIIVVDWGSLAQLEYNAVIPYLKSIGAITARFIDFLCSTGYLTNLKNVHLIGFGFGGHIAGFTGRSIRNGRIGVIHALQAAGPEFNGISENDRLNKNDAKYVQSIHTNIARWGYIKPIGHVDYYPAYGRYQPACGRDDWCSHNICADYFAESIRSSRGFVARQCSSTSDIWKREQCSYTGTKSNMGPDPLSKKYYGVYYLPMRKTSPYACGDFE